MPDETSASGRPALADTRDVDWERLVARVHSLPFKRKKWGLAKTVAWGRTQLRSLVGVISLAADEATTPEQVKQIRAVRLFLTPGPLMVLSRGDAIGLEARTKFLACVEAILLEPTLRAVFRRTPAPGRTPYEPKTSEKPEET